jgi:hypothetical protein
LVLPELSLPARLLRPLAYRLVHRCCARRSETRPVGRSEVVHLKGGSFYAL